MKRVFLEANAWQLKRTGAVFNDFQRAELAAAREKDEIIQLFRPALQPADGESFMENTNERRS